MADPRHAPPDPGSPLPDIQRALEEQYTDEVRDHAHRYAEQRARRVRKAGRPIPKNYADELLQDALTSVWLGTRRWDPLRTPLLYRLITIIKDRTWREIRRAQTYQHLSFDAAANDSSIDMEAAMRVRAEASVGDLRLATFTAHVVEELRALARNDEQACRILACWAQGLVEPDEIMAQTGLTRPAFEAARLRILRLSKRLPPELREAALDLLRSAS